MVLVCLGCFGLNGLKLRNWGAFGFCGVSSVFGYADNCGLGCLRCFGRFLGCFVLPV